MSLKAEPTWWPQVLEAQVPMTAPAWDQRGTSPAPGSTPATPSSSSATESRSVAAQAKPKPKPHRP